MNGTKTCAIGNLLYSSKYYCDKKLKTCQEQPYLVSGHLIKKFYKTTTCPRRLLSAPKSSGLIKVWLYKYDDQKKEINSK